MFRTLNYINSCNCIHALCLGWGINMWILNNRLWRCFHAWWWYFVNGIRWFLNLRNRFHREINDIKLFNLIMEYVYHLWRWMTSRGLSKRREMSSLITWDLWHEILESRFDFSKSQKLCKDAKMIWTKYGDQLLLVSHLFNLSPLSCWLILPSRKECFSFGFQVTCMCYMDMKTWASHSLGLLFPMIYLVHKSTKGS